MEENAVTPSGKPYSPLDSVAVPGQSLTRPKGEYPWEQPPQFSDPDKAIAELMDKISKPDNMAKVFALLENGVTVVALVDAMVLTGFATGKYNPNVSELIKPDLREFIMILAEKAEIEYTEGSVKPRDAFQDTVDELKTKKAEIKERGNPREPADIADEEVIVEEPVEEKKGLMMNERPTGIMARGGM